MTEKPQQRGSRVNLTSVALLFVAVVAIAVGLIGIAVRGTPPWTLIAPILLGVYSILTLRTPR